jgi:Tfp pilus assembly protein PilV
VLLQVLAADVRRTQLLDEEAELYRQFDEQETTDAVAGAAVKGSSALWEEGTWAAKLARFAALGAEMEASGAAASESKVCFAI